MIDKLSRVARGALLAGVAACVALAPAVILGAGQALAQAAGGAGGSPDGGTGGSGGGIGAAGNGGAAGF